MTAERLRFAPSPTGSLHVGNARTALVNWLVTRQTGGSLILRIEDTDVVRNQQESEATILDDLSWMGIDWDEGPGTGGNHGPYRQSERTHRYVEVVSRLLDSGHLYPCFESAEDLAALRDETKRSGEPLCFRGEHRDASAAEAAELYRRGGAVLRLKVPDVEVRFVDGLAGETGLAVGEIGDFVVARADGSPTYNLAVVVDDHDMEVSSVIRGADHLTNTPRQLLLYEAMGWDPPSFTHLPLVLGPDKSRLSKRHGATSVAQMRTHGILPEALCNFLALLGWSPPNEQEVLTPEELVAAYDIAEISPANAVFDVTKLEWLNGQHLARLSAGDLLRRAAPFLAADGVVVPEDAAAREWLADTLALTTIGRRVLADLAEPLLAVLYPPAASVAAHRGELEDPESRAALAALAAASRVGELLDEAGYLECVKRIREATGIGGRKLFHPLRVAISGADSGPELKQLVPLLEQGARLDIDPPVASVAERIDGALATSDAAAAPGD